MNAPVSASREIVIRLAATIGLFTMLIFMKSSARFSNRFLIRAKCSPFEALSNESVKCRLTKA